jgi:SAM-dependent methyltransferase
MGILGHMESIKTFDELAELYEPLTDWPRRLANEEPFYRRLFSETGVGSVLDAACGTGHHAAMFHSWGMRVEGADLSRAMIDRARAAFGENDSLRWRVRAFDRHVVSPDVFDAAICVGNSLALASDEATARRAIGAMLAAVRPGGLLIVHLLNPWRLPDGAVQWQKCKRVERQDEKELLVLRGIHRHGRGARLELLAVDLSDARILHAESTSLLCFEAEELQGMALEAGAAKVELFGDYQRRPYDRTQSADLIMVVWRNEYRQ